MTPNSICRTCTSVVDSIVDQDPLGFTLIGLSWIQIRIWNADPDLGAWKLTKIIKNLAYCLSKKAYVHSQKKNRRYPVRFLTCYLHKVKFNFLWFLSLTRIRIRIRIGFAPWIRIRIETKSWIRKRYRYRVPTICFLIIKDYDMTVLVFLLLTSRSCSRSIDTV